MSIAATADFNPAPSHPLLPLSITYRTSPDRNYFAHPGNWRAWGFRTWRLERYFANTPLERLGKPGSDKG